jgi:hypothetical protein
MKKLLFILVSGLLITSCTEPVQQRSDSGVKKATTTVKTDLNGQTVEQQNIIERLKRDNDIGSVKHLYVISSYTGDVLQYSTVKGKVTSGGKRLSPRTVSGNSGGLSGVDYNSVNIGGVNYVTDEVLDDGGAYGDSGNYLFWFDTQGNYHQYYPSGGTYLEICDKPLHVKKTNFSITLN